MKTARERELEALERRLPWYRDQVMQALKRPTTESVRKIAWLTLGILPIEEVLDEITTWAYESRAAAIMRKKRDRWQASSVKKMADGRSKE